MTIGTVTSKGRPMSAGPWGRPTVAASTAIARQASRPRAAHRYGRMSFMDAPFLHSGVRWRPKSLPDNPAMHTPYDIVGVVGAGAMGRGIAQIAAQSGSAVHLYDTQPAALERALKDIGTQWDRLVEKGRMDAAQAQACKQRLQAAGTLAALRDCKLVVEAIVERLDIKQALFRELEGIVGQYTVLATNTS